MRFAIGEPAPFLQSPAMETPSTPPALAIAGPTDDEKMIGMLAHLITFMSSFIGPLVIYLVKKDESAFIGDQAKEVLNFHLSVLIYFAIAFVSLFLVVGFFLLPALGVFVFVVTIVGAIRAYEGKAYRYPLCIRFIS